MQDAHTAAAANEVASQKIRYQSDTSSRDGSTELDNSGNVEIVRFKQPSVVGSGEGSLFGLYEDTTRQGRRTQETSRRVDPTIFKRLRELEDENERLRERESAWEVPKPPPLPSYRPLVLHNFVEDSRISGTYLDDPQWQQGAHGPELSAGRSLRNIEDYLDRHPEVIYILHKDYDINRRFDDSEVVDKDGVFRTPKPFRESISLTSDLLLDAMEIFFKSIPDFDFYFPQFRVEDEIAAPYLPFYYALPYLEVAMAPLEELHRKLVRILTNSILNSHGEDYTKAKNLFDRGRVSQRYMQYLIRPGDVLVEGSGPMKQAFVAKSWLTEHTRGNGGVRREDYADEPYTMKSRREKGSKIGAPEIMYFVFSWSVKAWQWSYNGSFHQSSARRSIYMKVTFENDEVDIKDLNVFPLMYADRKIRQELELRGKMFWKCRFKHIVSYTGSQDDGLIFNDARHMIDTATYNKLHIGKLQSIEAAVDRPADITPERMAVNDPIVGNDLLLFPPKMMGYNLHAKRWYELYVDQMKDVDWNTQAFKTLVMAEDTKELILALVENQLEAKKSTDLISGKGSGLIVLLHGGPGTGKTFTAESVAEIAKKPLYRITCGEVGTDPLIVEKRLTAILHLGKIWDCVVLLDEADVFLEERDLRDVHRNALVSVFLHVLEYYDGILILTSNLVGAFDEAFKSRIQLVLHYKDLNEPQRRKVWRNFINRLKELGEAIDSEDLEDHLAMLGKEELNGRQIRNAITTARQLAKYKKRPLCYDHLKHVITVSSQFEQYMKDLKGGQTDRERKKLDEI
ncbi:uncharacterized protein Z520_06480 [Fonsecaea multimorphosa CBS 102226]|uniref:AAA+ ATPase domain-containing protein n=1 Tax=Fonsecaea multimorphosa CBS 102226 TaxID=1442371 RepID=A0A0D2JW32_9EURO|nr:uncharacterized protein Z520_06480 [Fonsecaea multimorphosa CBS 102226]KIX97702.1 hypothetical protein Z520_06480 [Fonsecaea multimorphosa CBS 102226]